MKDHGRRPYVVDIEQATLVNDTFRTTLWTGGHLQLTVMAIPPGDDIGLEKHDATDQFLRIEQGTGRVQMGKSKKKLDFDRQVTADWVILVPAGYWHNVTNMGQDVLKLYSLYAPPDHEPGTVHPTKADAQADPAEH